MIEPREVTTVYPGGERALGGVSPTIGAGVQPPDRRIAARDGRVVA